MALTERIVCNGIKPKKSEVYLLAAELVETEEILGFKAVIVEAFKSYNYYDYDDYNDYDNYDDYDDYYYDYDKYYYCDYYEFSFSEKVIALLLLSAMYAEKGE